MRDGIKGVLTAFSVRMDAAFIKVGFFKLCLLILLCVIVLAVAFANLLFLLLTDTIPSHTNSVAGFAAILAGSPLIVILVSAFWRSNRDRTAIREQADLLDQRNIALAAAEESLRYANETLEARVQMRTADLERARYEAEEANAAKSQFLANMSHELRTPLNAIIGFSDMLMMRHNIFDDASEQRIDEYSDTINGAGRHLLSLVNDLLDLARIECGQTDFSPERLCVETLMDETAAFLRHQAKQRDQIIETDIATGSRFFDGDARGIHQILVNLLSNALKFSPSGSIVRFSVTGDAAGTTFSVADEGIGMTAQETDAALQPFSRLSEAHIAAGESIGLGLSITNALVAMHGGTLAFASEKNVGTTARVYIPANLGRAADSSTLAA